MPIVRADDLAQWAASQPPDSLVVLGNQWEFEDADSDICVKPVASCCRTMYLFRWNDAPDMGFILEEETTEVGDGWMRGTAIMSVGGNW